MRKKGYILPLTIFIGLFLLIMLSILLNTIINQSSLKKQKKENLYFQYLAEGEAEAGLYYLLSAVEEDINKTYSTGSKTTSLNYLPDNENIIVTFNPDNIQYQLQKIEIGENQYYYVIKSIINSNIFEITSKCINNSYSITYRVSINLNQGFNYKIDKIYRSRWNYGK